tara:strand:+ start:263 stop:628 length:366 start_codon:yes stop_codon:yes gene_type:complete
MPRKFSNISRRDVKKKNPPPPAPTINQRNVSTKPNGSMIGNMAGGMASGFGLGTGIEAARGISNSIFGSKENNVSETNIPGNEENGCKMLSEMIVKCQENKDGFNDCSNLLQMFSDKCLNK